VGEHLPARRVIVRIVLLAAALGVGIAPTEAQETIAARTERDGVAGQLPARHPIARPRSGGADGGDRTSGLAWLGKLAAGALVVAALGVAVVVVQRRRGVLEPEGAFLRVVGRRPLSPRHTLHLVQAGDRLLLVGTGSSGAPALLGSWDAGEAGETSTVPKPGGAPRGGRS
jgi:hypothetical protein